MVHPRRMTTLTKRSSDRLAADDSRWTAVLGHDRGADGAFVYAVRSTGVYCRPSCPSRRPRRDRVAFFDSTTAAREAGFRACLRCKPDATRAVADPWAEKVRRACVYLSNVEGHPALATLAARLGGSPYHLQRNFKRLVGVTPREYAEACRLGKVRRTLRKPGDITGAMLDAGYGSSSRFYERAVPKLGMAPPVYARRRRHADPLHDRRPPNEALGRLLVAATTRGVCAVAMAHPTPTHARGRGCIRRRRGRPVPVRWRNVRTLSSRTSRGANRGSTCRSMSRRPRSNGRSGRPLPRSHTARRGPTARSPRRSAVRVPSAPWRAPARRIRLRSRFRVIGFCRRGATPAGTAGELDGRRRPWRGSAFGPDRSARSRKSDPT